MANAYSKLNSIRPSILTEIELYAVLEDEELINGSVMVCNQDSVENKFYIALTDISGSAQNDDWIQFNTKVPAEDSVSVEGIALTAGQTIRIKASKIDVISFVLVGMIKS